MDGSSRTVIAPRPNAATTVSSAFCASSAHLTVGSSSAGGIRSTHRRIAVGLPHCARATINLAVSSAVAANTSCIAMVFLLRAPGGRPAGLPLWPGWNRMTVLLFKFFSFVNIILEV